MKILALDIGDRWTGIALSDPIGLLAKPYKTVKTNELIDFLTDLLATEPISTIVVGLPWTLRGTESEQTRKTKAIAQELKEKFGTIEWVLWDERLTSKQAAKLKRTKTKEEKLHSHAIAAALILSTYLEYVQIHKKP